MKQRPTVSMILPVYNGEEYIEEAMDSIINQTFEDFELLISDNASTDKTEQICRRYVKIDSRISYFRNIENIGAAKNFNILYEKCRGKYFKWIAHDDICAPSLLDKCVEKLEKFSDIVLCFSKVKIVDKHGQLIKNYAFKQNGTAEDAYKRMFYQIRGHQCYEIFGIIRKDALDRTKLIENYAGGDAVLLINLCLQGKFLEIPEYLFYSRKHSKQSTIMQKNMRKYAIWFDPKKNRMNLPYWRILFEYIKTVKTANLKRGERILCFSLVVLWGIRRSKLLMKDIITVAMSK